MPMLILMSLLRLLSLFSSDRSKLAVGINVLLLTSRLEELRLIPSRRLDRLRRRGLLLSSVVTSLLTSRRDELLVKSLRDELFPLFPMLLRDELRCFMASRRFDKLLRDWLMLSSASSLASVAAAFAPAIKSRREELLLLLLVVVLRRLFREIKEVWLSSMGQVEAVETLRRLASFIPLRPCLLRRLVLVELPALCLLLPCLLLLPVLLLPELRLDKELSGLKFLESALDGISFSFLTLLPVFKRRARRDESFCKLCRLMRIN